MAYTAVNKSSLHHNNVIYDGNNSTQSITGVGFQPDFSWIKSRNNTDDFALFDSIRGATKFWSSNNTATESTNANSLTAFDSDGFSCGDANIVNGGTSRKYISWNWKAGTTSGLSGGTITPTAYSINTTSGFGIYKRTGTATAGTIAHGLGAVPKFIISKNISWGSNVRIYHSHLGNTKTINLNETAVQETNSMWNDTTPTDTVYSVGSNNDGNKSGDTYIDYVFCEKRGFSKMLSWAGGVQPNFLYCGFKPQFLLCKAYNNGGENWALYDDKREGYNPQNDRMFPNNATQEADEALIDFVSNGITLRDTQNGHISYSGFTYIGVAFGQSIVGSNNVPATAR